MKTRTKTTCPTLERCAQVISEQRAFLGLSQMGLAEKSGLSHGAIACFESLARSPSVVSLIKIAEALDLSMVDFFELVESAVVKKKYKAKVINKYGLQVGWRCRVCGKEYKASPEMRREIKALKEVSEKCCGEVSP